MESEKYYTFQNYLSLFTIISHHAFIYLSNSNDSKETFQQQSLIESELKNTSKYFINPSKNKNEIFHIKRSSIRQNSIDINNYKLELVNITKPGIIGFMNKSVSKILENITEVNEFINVKILKIIKTILETKTIFSYKKIIPRFSSYFYYDSPILTLLLLNLFENYKLELNQGRLLKLLLKLCLLINDIRTSDVIKLSIIKWIYSLYTLKFNNFDFSKVFSYFEYYLQPMMVDSLSLKLEKVKLLFILYSELPNTSTDSIMQIISIFDIYKYFSIFSKSCINLFKVYFYTIIKFPEESLINQLCNKIKENLKIVPKILPNMINLLQKIKKIDSDQSICIKTNRITEDNRMCFNKIYMFLANKLTEFLANFKSHNKLINYFFLFTELSREENINPSNIVTGLHHLKDAYKKSKNWKYDSYILQICVQLLRYHSIDIMRKHNIEQLLFDIHLNSFDYGIKDLAKLYYNLVVNVEKELLILFIDNKISSESIINKSNENFPLLKLHYNIKDYKQDLKMSLILSLSTNERENLNIFDDGSAFFDNNFFDKLILLTNSYKEEIKYSEQYYLNVIQCNFNLHLDFDNYLQINTLINKYLTINDIMKLSLSNQQIELVIDTNITNIDEEKIYTHLKGHTEINETINILDVYFKMIDSNEYFIKIPLNLYLVSKNQFNLEKLYSIILNFGYSDHLIIKQPILLPYIEKQIDEDLNINFPYFYKFELFIFPLYPIPSEIDVQASFFDENSNSFTGNLNKVKVKFEDFFCPITFNINNNQNHSYLKEILFTKLWETFDYNYINSCRLINKSRSEMINIVKNKLGPFVINNDYFTVEPNKIININEKIDEYDFGNDSIVIKGSNRKDSNVNSLNLENNLIEAKVLIFLPKKYHLLFNIKISEISSVIKIKTDCMKVIEYFDEYFDSWEK